MPNAGTLFSNQTYAQEQLALYYAKQQGAYTICKYSGNTVAYQPLSDLTANYKSLIASARAHAPGEFLASDTDPTVIHGYKVQRNLLLDLYATTKTPVQETGFSSGNEIPLTLSKPLSRGSVTINSTNPLAPPMINWGALTNPVDLEIMVAAVRRHRKLMATDAMMELGPTELTPGANVTTDDQLRAALRQQTQPTYSHLTATCSMMKREYGGVVGPDLLVYGIKGLSVVDASIMPLIPAAHTSSTVYAVAEKVRFALFSSCLAPYCLFCANAFVVKCRLRISSSIVTDFGLNHLKGRCRSINKTYEPLSMLTSPFMKYVSTRDRLAASSESAMLRPFQMMTLGL